VARRKINPGELRHRVSFYLDNGSGHPGPPLYTPDNPRYWCAFRTLGGEIKYTAQTVWQQTTGEIVMRYTKVPFGEGDQYVLEDIDAGWFALLDEKYWYRVQLVINEDNRNKVLVLTVSYFGPYQPDGGEEPPPGGGEEPPPEEPPPV